MFKVPDWAEDVSKSNINLRKQTPATKKQKGNDVGITSRKKPKPLVSPKKVRNIKAPAAKQTNVIENIKTQPKKRKHNGQIINNKKKKPNDGENSIDVSNIDTDKLDEVLLNAKKKKFYEPMKGDDVEHILFKEETRTINVSEPVKLSSNGKQLSKIIDKSIPKCKNNKLKNKKNKLAPEPENERLKKVFQIKKNTNENNKFVTNNVIDRKKEKFKGILQAYNTRNSINVTGNKLRERMLERLKAAQFRYLNEKLYTSSGTEAKELFQSDPAAFHTYHQGYQQQLKKWPVNPLDVIAKRIQKMPKTHAIADMGCGEAALTKRIPHKVRSFDLVSTAPGVEICDMAHTPLLTESIDVAVYCLALMGTELTQYLVEANRVLKMGGHLLIAEVESRFDDPDAFAKEVMRLGFKLKNLDKKHKVFFFMEFIKIRDPPAKKSKLPMLTLKPCLYKRR